MAVTCLRAAAGVSHSKQRFVKPGGAVLRPHRDRDPRPAPAVGSQTISSGSPAEVWLGAHAAAYGLHPLSFEGWHSVDGR
jgi:hypothetical protein